MENTGIKVKLESFEGPLDLLLHLIDKNKVNIYDIPISLITKQYLEYLEEMKRQDLNIMSEFLVMAATLLDIKAKMLLPAEVDEDGEEKDPRDELVQQLIEYKIYKYMSYELRDRHIDAARNLFKPETLPEHVKAYTPPINHEELIGDVTLGRLNEIFKSMMKRQVDRIDPVRASFGKIEKEEVNMEEVMFDLEDYCRSHKDFSFRELMDKQPSKMKMIVVFLSILELMKVGKIEISQEKIFGDIKIRSKIVA